MGLDLNKYSKVFRSVETHTVGEPTRMITSGFPEIPGKTMMEKKKFLEEHCDQYRAALMCEPRGHKDMVGAVILPPVHEEADLGVVYMDAERWINMCGHASIGCAAFAVETGVVKVTEPVTKIVLDTPAGIVPTEVKVKNGKAVEVTISNVPAFLYQDHIIVDMDDHKVEAAVSFGGAFFALIDASQLGLELEASDVQRLIPYTAKLLGRMNEMMDFYHPELDISRVVNAEYYLKKDDLRQRNIVIAEGGQVDRSPCGTGTSAKLAYLYATDQIKEGEIFVNENFTGAVFKGTVKKATQIGEFRAIYPMITGSAYISGEAIYVIDEDDPVKYGFLI